MLDTPRVPFGEDWARAARTVVDVTTISYAQKATTAPDGIFVHAPRLQPGRLFRPLRSWYLARQAANELLRRGRPVDLVHGHFYSAGPLVGALASRLRVPYVLTEHSSRLTGRSANSKPLTQRGLAMARTAHAGSARSIAVSQYLADSMTERDVRVTDVIGNPVRVDLFRPSDHVEPRIVSVGRLERDKRPDLLIHAFAHIATSHPEVELHVFGDGPDRAEIERTVEDLGVRGRVVLHGRRPREEVAAAVASSACFAAAPSVETFGMAAAEAAASGTRVVVPDLPALRNALGSSPSVRFAMPDVEGFATELDRALSPPRTGADLALRQSVEQRFGDDAVGRALLEVYLRALDR